MRVLVCDGIHEDGLALFRDAGRDWVASGPIKDAAALSGVEERTSSESAAPASTS